MSLQKPTIVLFDMDGTVVRHVNPRLLGVLEWLDDMVFRLGKFFRRGEINAPLAEDLKKKPRLLVHRALHKIRRKPVEQIVQPCPGIYAVLGLLQAHGVPMGVVSNGLGKGYGHDILKKFSLEGFFTSQIFREDIQRSKPHPDPLFRALKGIRDEDLSADDVVWYIGDRHKDVLAAVAAHEHVDGKVLPFCYGLHGAVAVLEKGFSPDHIIMSYHDFAESVEEIFADKDKDANGDQRDGAARSVSKSAS